MSLILIPCWWDGSIEPLIETIKFQRPDVFPSSLLDKNNSTKCPISLNAPSGFFSTNEIPDIGELMLASFPAINNAFNSSISKDNAWWMGEKYDGVRCCWNPVEKQITAKELTLLSSVVNQLPHVFMDIELWFGRGKYNHSQRVVNEGDLALVRWHNLRTVAFDIPSYDFQTFSFETRFTHLLSRAPYHHPFLKIVASRIMCEVPSLLENFLQQIINNYGEGVILRKPNTLYERGRSPNLVKLKGTQGDREALVMSVAANRSVSLKLPDGALFEVGPEDIEWKGPLVNGDIVTFSYESYARRENPVKPKILRIRTDLSWLDVCNNQVSSNEDVNVKSSFTTQPQSYWNDKTMRQYLENYARKRNLDPLHAESWFHISPSDLNSSKGGKYILQNFKGYIRTLQALFPEIGLNLKELSQFYGLYKWSDIVNRRKFFEEFAAVHGFDPKNPENWYAQTREKILSFQGASSILKYYNGSMSQALVDIFPDIGLDKYTFYKGFWSVNQRNFFENYAKQNGFDPLVAENWYNQPRRKIMAMKGALGAVYSFNNSVSLALCSLFPNIGLKQSLFYRDKWKDVNNQRMFFEKYARKQGLDPLLAATWYSISREHLLSEKGAGSIMNYYSGSLVKALTHIFGDLNLEKSKFFKSEKNSKFCEITKKKTNVKKILPNRDGILKSRSGVLLRLFFPASKYEE